MTNITDLRSSLEAFRKAGTIDTSIYANLTSKLKAAEIEFESVEKEALVYKENLDKLLAEKLVLEREKSSLAAQVIKLSNEKAELESRISTLQKSRPVLSSSNLVSSFASSLAEMDKGLKKVQSGSKYLVSNMNVTLKTNIALEEGELRFQLPKADDIISPENLSTIEFSLRASPEKPGIDSYVEVPGLVWLSKEEAESKLLESGFKVGNVLEIESSKPQGTVLAQLPSEGSLAEPGADVDLTVSRFLSVKVPDLVGLGIEAAKVLLEKSRLLLEGVKEQPSDKDPGTVLAQSLGPGSEVEANSAIVLTVSTKVYKVPNLLGLELESAKKVIEKSGLQPGGVNEQPSSGKSGVVLTQSPKPGLEVEANSKVDIVVSTEEKEVVPEKPLRPIPETIVKETIPKVTLNTSSKLQPETTTKVSRETSVGASAGTPGQDYKLVPGVTGMSLEKAVALLGAQEIKVGTISEAASTATGGTVISQNPGAGSMVNLSVPVNLTVSKKAPETQLRSSTLSRIKL
ncbi:PASTA domain-containing protein [Methanosarcina sp. T3]|uniref:PASTA domain-containing protein n=1 Tax=Methanosarcina sp. T3 TaxID=3439062 RepID=UPI003F875CB9